MIKLLVLFILLCFGLLWYTDDFDTCLQHHSYDTCHHITNR